MAKKQQPKPLAIPDRPEWINETPLVQYDLEMFCGETLQQITMTREEFELLKTYLAKIRGVKLEPEEEVQLAERRIA